jgi:hypothetical protein
VKTEHVTFPLQIYDDQRLVATEVDAFDHLDLSLEQLSLLGSSYVSRGPIDHIEKNAQNRQIPKHEPGVSQRAVIFNHKEKGKDFKHETSP